MTDVYNQKRPDNATAAIFLADGDIIWGRGIGAKGAQVGEICFNTGMSGYQETITDPSYAGQIITFTFPHIGNVGVNDDDMETARPFAKGVILRQDITSPSNWRSVDSLQNWLLDNDIIGICGIDTRALTMRIRDSGAPNGVICHAPDGNFDIPALIEMAKSWKGLKGTDLAIETTCDAAYEWDGAQEDGHKVVAVDFGAKRNILRCLANSGCKVHVVPANATADEILQLNPKGVFLSNGPGDPQATGKYAIPMINSLLEKNIPIFGICLGHQLLSLALGAKTQKMSLGHRGANHPVKDLQTGKIEITSQNHGFEVISDSLPSGVTQTHISLFDGSNEGIKLDGRDVFSVQYHPEASPGPCDSYYLFDKFAKMLGQ